MPEPSAGSPGSDYWRYELERESAIKERRPRLFV
jgi:hypothetical protein